MSENNSLISCVLTHQDNTESYYDSIHECAKGQYVFWDKPLSAWVVTGYDECNNLLQDSRLGRARLSFPQSPQSSDLVEFAQRVLDAQVMFSDDPGLLSCRKYWSHVASEGIDDTIRVEMPALASSVLEKVNAGSKVDTINELFEPYVSRIISTRLGIEEQERLQVYPYVLQYVRFLDGKIGRKVDFERALFSIAALYSKLAKKWDKYGEEDSNRHQWISNFLLTLVAGHESTAYLLGIVILNAGGENGELVTAATDQRRLSRIVVEALRYDSPVQLIGRQTSEDLSLNGHCLKRGDRVYLHIGAANRDSRVFDRAGEFDSSRLGPAPLSFGVGKSQCLGRSLALQGAVSFLSTMNESRVVFDVELAQVKWNNGLAGRGLASLPAIVRTFQSQSVSY